MRYTTSSEHQDYFSKQGMIEFEELLSAKEIEELEMKTEELLAGRMACAPAKLEYQTAKNLFLAGRNLSREDGAVKKIVMHQRFVDLAFSTLHAPRLRLAYDEYIRTGAQGGTIFNHAYSLQGVSCFQSIVCGFLIKLCDTESPIPFPQKKGSVLFFKGSTLFPWDTLFETPHQRHLLIAYGSQKLIYTLEKNDPHTHALKREGYVFGDLLANATHPTLGLR